MTRHHITPKSRGGEDTEGNMVYLQKSLHVAWHGLFGVLTPDQAINFSKSLSTKERWYSSDIEASCPHISACKKIRFSKQVFFEKAGVWVPKEYKNRWNNFFGKAPFGFSEKVILAVMEPESHWTWAKLKKFREKI